MIKIKLLIVKDSYYDYESAIDSLRDISDWEEVNEKDLEFIQDNLWRLNTHHEKFVLVRQDSTPVTERIVDIKKKVEAAKKAAEREEAEKLRKKEELAQKKLEKKLAKDREALRKLIQNNPDILKEINND